MYLLYEQTSVVPINGNICYLKTKVCIILAIKRNKRDWALPSSNLPHRNTKQRQPHPLSPTLPSVSPGAQEEGDKGPQKVSGTHLLSSDFRQQ